MPSSFYLILVGVVVLRVEAFTPYTVKDYMLAVQPYLGVHTTDWLTCIEECTNDPTCLSYTFHFGQELDGRSCKLYNCSLDTKLAKRELVYSRGYVFQQLKPVEIQQMCRKGTGDYCARQPCHHSSTCIELVNGYYCACARGYTGSNCHTEINECASSPCLYDGTCTDVIDGYKCNCLEGLTGRHCEKNIDDCPHSLCYNNATCVDGINSYRCICVPGYTGPACEANIQECQTNPCLNGGTCVDQVNGFLCTCSDGYNGSRCELDINECASNPCLHGGSCLDEINGYTCLCKNGYSGGNCEIKHIGQCRNDPCKNGGTCINLHQAKYSLYWCRCPSNYWGYTCEKIRLHS